MPPQHTKERAEEIVQKEGFVIPLNLPEFRLLSQEQHEDGSVSLKVLAVSAPCPHCQQMCGQIHAWPGAREAGSEPARGSGEIDHAQTSLSLLWVLQRLYRAGHRLRAAPENDGALAGGYQRPCMALPGFW